MGRVWSGLGQRLGGVVLVGFEERFVEGVGELVCGDVGGIDVGDVWVLGGASGGEGAVGGEPELAADGGQGVVVDSMELGDELGVFGDEAVQQGDVAAVVVIAQAGQGCEWTVGRELVGEGAKACELFKQRVLRGGGRDVWPVGFEQLEVGVDGGGRDIELLGDFAERPTSAPEAMGFEDAGAALRAGYAWENFRASSVGGIRPTGWGVVKWEGLWRCGRGGLPPQPSAAPPAGGSRGSRSAASHCNEEVATRLRGRRAVGRFGAWLMRWWSHGFLPAQE